MMQKKFQGSVDDGINTLIEALYEIQRGYNLNKNGEEKKSLDNIGKDRNICAGGAYNKFFEKLWGCHSDVELTFTTHQTAAFKFKSTLKHEILDFFSNDSSYDADNKEALLKAVIAEKTAQPIWSFIAKNDSNKQFAEFSELYSNSKNNNDFLALIQRTVNDKLDSDFMEKLKNINDLQPISSRVNRFYQPRNDKVNRLNGISLSTSSTVPLI